MITALFLLLCYGVALRRLESHPQPLPFTPHHAMQLPDGRRKWIWIAWISPLLIALALCLGDVTADFGKALFVVVSVSLFLAGGYDLLSLTQMSRSTPQKTVQWGRDLFDTPLKPTGAVQLAEGLYASSQSVEKTDLAPWLPEELVRRILSNSQLAEQKTADLAAQNLKLNAAYTEWREKATRALADLASETNAKNQLLQTNATLRAKVATGEPPFVQMTVEELDRARKRRMQEIAVIDDLQTKRNLKKGNKPDNTLPLTFQ